MDRTMSNRSVGCIDQNQDRSCVCNGVVGKGGLPPSKRCTQGRKAKKKQSQDTCRSRSTTAARVLRKTRHRASITCLVRVARFRRRFLPPCPPPFLRLNARSPTPEQEILVCVCVCGVWYVLYSSVKGPAFHLGAWSIGWWAMIISDSRERARVCNMQSSVACC